jgi:hypothetical protein
LKSALTTELGWAPTPYSLRVKLWAAEMSEQKRTVRRTLVVLRNSKRAPERALSDQEIRRPEYLIGGLGKLP